MSLRHNRRLRTLKQLASAGLQEVGHAIQEVFQWKTRYPPFLDRPIDGLARRIGTGEWDALHKLHVGCGSTILRTYTNVDLPPDSQSFSDQTGVQEGLLRASLDDLSMVATNSVDVVEGYHVIEHLPSWRGQKALNEFYRVLKPAGELVLECPDLQLCALNFIEKPDTPSLGINGLYSEQDSHLASMVHQYGYTPNSLALALQKAGFQATAIIQIPARRYRNRDLRLLAIKGSVQQDTLLSRASDHLTTDTISTYKVTV